MATNTALLQKAAKSLGGVNLPGTDTELLLYIAEHLGSGSGGGGTTPPPTGGGSTPVGTFADLAALQAAIPTPADHKTALVGAKAPYTQYYSKAGAWVKGGTSNGSTGISQADQAKLDHITIANDLDIDVIHDNVEAVTNRVTDLGLAPDAKIGITESTNQLKVPKQTVPSTPAAIKLDNRLITIANAYEIEAALKQYVDSNLLNKDGSLKMDSAYTAKDDNDVVTMKTIKALPTGGGTTDSTSMFQFSYKVEVGTVDATPNTGIISFDNADPKLATKIYLNKNDSKHNDISLFLKSLAAGDYFNIHDNNNINDFIAFDITKDAVQTGNVFMIEVKKYADAGVIKDGEKINVHWEKIGNGDKVVYKHGDKYYLGYGALPTEQVSIEELIDLINGYKQQQFVKEDGVVINKTAFTTLLKNPIALQVKKGERYEIITSLYGDTVLGSGISAMNVYTKTVIGGPSVTASEMKGYQYANNNSVPIRVDNLNMVLIKTTGLLTVDFQSHILDVKNKVDNAIVNVWIKRVG